MHLLYVVQRYGEGVAGGAEQHTRMFAERLAARGHTVEVLTTCASSYVDWANTLPEGTRLENGVAVHRLPVARRRDYDGFGDINARLLLSARRRPLPIQRHWMWAQGPYVPELVDWLRRRSPSYDAAVFVTYLYWTTWAGLQVAAGAVPTILHPTAHQERPLQLSLFDEVFNLPDALALLTPEELELVRERFPSAPAGDVVGVGVHLASPGDEAEFRTAHGLGDSPYLLYVGRVDTSKGAEELLDYFVAYKNRHAGDLRLVLLGEPVLEIPPRDDIIVTGFVADDMVEAALAGALALVQPSYFESFSMVLVEAFAQARPALVQARCDVLAGHAARSGAAIPYTGFAQFEAAVELLVDDPQLALAMGDAGRAYAQREYTWDVVLDRYERLLERTIAGRSLRIPG